MQVALVGALPIEVAPLIARAQAVEVERRLGQPVYRGQLGAHSVLLAQLGVGKVRAAAALQSLIERHPLDAVICFGSAGALNPALQVGDIILAERVTQHDYVLMLTPDILGGREQWLRTDAQLTAKLLAAGQRVGFADRIRIGSIITGDTVIGALAARDQLWQTFKADAVEMEGAAIGLVCQLNGIPFAVVRGLSDQADEHGVTTFRQNIQRVSADVAAVVSECVCAL